MQAIDPAPAKVYSGPIKGKAMKDLTGAEYERRATEALGGRGWQKAMSAAIGVDASTIRRWTSGVVPVPTYAVAVLELLEATPAAFRPPRWLR
ncbi:hypothetical protein UFOVP233_40 [uncultured Caudovirales phage]|uniref:HTH cro/C1-type domain-containing protein n=1 Tax=uncultured Caudovirales phage TaxID=2100421 RepID=A0A6J7WVY3_9CAUD|nr:hypothetical protein UFOVP233_40 [uncultured Caudovirales phage]